MTDHIFFAESIEYTFPRDKIGKREIDEIDDFPGRQDFIDFYLAHNGLCFPMGAIFCPEPFYNVVLREPDNSIDFFLSIPVEDGDNSGINIEREKDIVVENHSKFEDFVLFHIPFAENIIQNVFWIDIQSGEIKYTDFQAGDNPDDAITVASSFRSFCKGIKNRH